MGLIWRVVLPDRGIILLGDGDEDALEPVVVKLSEDIDGDIVISKAVIKKAIADKSAILLQDAPRDPRFENSDSIIASAVRSVICAPLIAQGSPLGVIYIDSQMRGGSDQRRWTAELFDTVDNTLLLQPREIQKVHSEFVEQALRNHLLDNSNNARLAVLHAAGISLMEELSEDLALVPDRFSDVVQAVDEVLAGVDWFSLTNDRLMRLAGDVVRRVK